MRTPKLTFSNSAHTEWACSFVPLCVWAVHEAMALITWSPLRCICVLEALSAYKTAMKNTLLYEYETQKGVKDYTQLTRAVKTRSSSYGNRSVDSFVCLSIVAMVWIAANDNGLTSSSDKKQSSAFHCAIAESNLLTAIQKCTLPSSYLPVTLHHACICTHVTTINYIPVIVSYSKRCIALFYNMTLHVVNRMVINYTIYVAISLA